MAVALWHPPQGSRAARAQQRLRTAEAHQSVHALLLHGVVTYRRRLHHAARLRRLARGPQLLLVALLALPPPVPRRVSVQPMLQVRPSTQHQARALSRAGVTVTTRPGEGADTMSSRTRSSARHHANM